MKRTPQPAPQPSTSIARRRRARGLFALAATLLLLPLLLVALAWKPQAGLAAAPRQDAPDIPLPQVEPAADNQTDAVTFSLRVTPGASSDGSTAAVTNNQLISYTLRLDYPSGTALNNLRFETVLPPSGLSDVRCAGPACTLITTTVTVINQLGVPVPVVVPQEIQWNVTGASGTRVERVFTARVVSQVGGPVIENTALAFFNGSSLVSNKVTVSLVPSVPSLEPPGGGGELQVSANPNWFSNDQGGTLDMDWGDVDGDGDLDLALASTGGTRVYLNTNGLLTPLWTDPQGRQSYGVRWIDVDADGTPELVVVGQPNLNTGGGLNYVFRFNPGSFQSPTRFTLMPNGAFPTAEQLVRIEAGHFNGDNLPDLLVSVTAISAQCPVFILDNLGAALFTGPMRCVSQSASAALAVADADRDGDSDLALGIFPNQVRVLINANGVLTQTLPITGAMTVAQVDATGYFLPYDFAWGDIDNDGDLDLAAAFPFQREVRIYRNTPLSGGGMSFERLSPNLSTGVFLTPYAVDFGDLNRDGRLDLIVADAVPTIYTNNGGPGNPFVGEPTRVAVAGERGEIWSARAIDQNGDGTLELALANRNGPSLLLANFTPPLAESLTPVPGSGAASSVAWGDVNNDGYNDLLFGSPPTRNQSNLFLNTNGTFMAGDRQPIAVAVVGSHIGVLGDVDAQTLGSPGSGQVDMLVVTPSVVRISRDSGIQDITALPSLAGRWRAAALGDADGDGDLDLALAPINGQLSILENRLSDFGGTYTALTHVATLNNVSGLSWGDLNGDHYLDLAVAISSTGASRIYINNGDLTFRPFMLAAAGLPNGPHCLQGKVREISWGDVNSDGKDDLALAVDGQPSCVLINTSTISTPSLAFHQPLGAFTDGSTVDWGDWDNDGDMDLAIGRDLGQVRVYANLDGSMQLLWLSDPGAPFRARMVRFGDVDNDGDLDLALARAFAGNEVVADSGYFENRVVKPAHLAQPEDVPTLLAENSNYATVERPGETGSAYLFSSSEVLVSPTSPIVPINFRIFDPDGQQNDPPQNVRVRVEYAETGSLWKVATPAAGQSDVISTTLTREGGSYTYNWNAAADSPIGERARVRIAVINPLNGGKVQMAAGVGISPPFQIRATSCVWPADPQIFVDGVQVGAGRAFTVTESSGTDPFEFRVTLREGTGVMRFFWNFGDGYEVVGQRVFRTFVVPDVYNVTVRAVGEACPVAREARLGVTFALGDQAMPVRNWLPVVSRPPAATSAGTGAATGAAGDVPAARVSEAPAAVTGLAGSEQGGHVLLTWSPGAGGSPPTETRIYREPLGGAGPPVLEATLPPVVSAFVTAQGCGVVYTVAAANSAGETIGDAWLTPACSEGMQP